MLVLTRHVFPSLPGSHLFIASTCAQGDGKPALSHSASLDPFCISRFGIEVVKEKRPKEEHKSSE